MITIKEKTKETQDINNFVVYRYFLSKKVNNDEANIINIGIASIMNVNYKPLIISTINHDPPCLRIELNKNYVNDYESNLEPKLYNLFITHNDCTETKTIKGNTDSVSKLGLRLGLLGSILFLIFSFYLFVIAPAYFLSEAQQDLRIGEYYLYNTADNYPAINRMLDRSKDAIFLSIEIKSIGKIGFYTSIICFFLTIYLFKNQDNILVVKILSLSYMVAGVFIIAFYIILNESYGFIFPGILLIASGYLQLFRNRS